MKAFHCILISLLIPGLSTAQMLSGIELLEKSIEYHDPNSKWESFDGQFQVTMKTPGKSDRKTEIVIDLPHEYFYSKATRDSIIIEFSIDKENCEVLFNGNATFSEDIANKHQLNCERALLYKNYYTYLYGLPMKLKDHGTIINDKIETRFFKGKKYLVLNVSYTEEVGNDIWYFYFDPKSYALEVYQFFLDESKNDGEYVLLSEEEIIQEIKMPKVRIWHMNKDDKFLGTDILSSYD